MDKDVMQDFIFKTVQQILDDKASEALFDLDSNLIQEGILDSLGFINLLMTLESEFDLDIDFSELDPSEFTTIRGLLTHLVE